MNQKIIQIVTIQGDHATDRGLYALTDAGNLYCIGSDSKWVQLPDLPKDGYKYYNSYPEAFTEGVKHRMDKGEESYNDCPYAPGTEGENAWMQGFKR